MKSAEILLKVDGPNTITPFYVGRGLSKKVGEYLKGVAIAQAPCVVMTDETVARLYLPIVEKSLRDAGIRTVCITAPDGDSSKCLEQVQKIHKSLVQHCVERDSMFVGLGGGMVTDLTGFVAATWGRGAALCLVPTTLEAMVDACLGGKTAVNIPGGKNLVGAFHWPRIVIVDPDFLQTLTRRDWHAGLAESIKHAFLAGIEFIQWHDRRKEQLVAAEPSILEELILRNLRFKASVVENDPFERGGQRAMLNLGHTIGHAVEDVMHYDLRHGECVAMGMAAEAALAETIGVGNCAITAIVTQLLEAFGLPIRAPSDPRLTSEALLNSMRRDKKISGGTMRFVFLQEIGRAQVQIVAEADILAFVRTWLGESSSTAGALLE